MDIFSDLIQFASVTYPSRDGICAAPGAYYQHHDKCEGEGVSRIAGIAWYLWQGP